MKYVTIFQKVLILTILLAGSADAQSKEKNLTDCVDQIVIAFITGNPEKQRPIASFDKCALSEGQFVSQNDKSTPFIGSFAEQLFRDTEEQRESCLKGYYSFRKAIEANAQKSSYFVASSDHDILTELSHRAAFDSALSSAIASDPLSIANCQISSEIQIAAWVLARFDNAAWADMLLSDPNFKFQLMENEPAIEWLWYIAQHADYMVVFQKKALSLLEKIRFDLPSSAIHAAKLIDEITKREQEKQVFGTFFSCKAGKAVFDPQITDINKANTLRAEYGMPTLAEALEARHARCG